MFNKRPHDSSNTLLETSPETAISFLSFPDEIILSVFQWLPLNTLVTLFFVDSRLASLAKNDFLWKPRYQQFFASPTNAHLNFYHSFQLQYMSKDQPLAKLSVSAKRLYSCIRQGFATESTALSLLDNIHKEDFQHFLNSDINRFVFTLALHQGLKTLLHALYQKAKHMEIPSNELLSVAVLTHQAQEEIQSLPYDQLVWSNTEEFKRSAIYFAITENRIDIVQLLLSTHTLSLHYLCIGLTHALAHKHLAMVKQLLLLNLSMMNDHEIWILIFKNDCVEIVEWLLQMNKTCIQEIPPVFMSNYKNINNVSFLFIAIDNRSTHIIRYCFENGFNQFDISSFLLAIKNGDQDIFAYFIKMLASGRIDIKSNSPEVLLTCFNYNRKEMLDQLLKGNYIDSHALITKYNISLLTYAILDKNKEWVAWLLKHTPIDLTKGIETFPLSISLADTPLHIAARIGNVAIFLLLLDANPQNLWIKNANGEMPLEVAKEEVKENLCLQVKKQYPKIYGLQLKLFFSQAISKECQKIVNSSNDQLLQTPALSFPD